MASSAPRQLPLALVCAVLAWGTQVAAQEAPVVEDGPAEPAGDIAEAAPPDALSSPANPAELPAVGVEVAGGNGLTVGPDGSSRLHFTLDTAAGFDTNPYSLSLQDGRFGSDMVVRLRPGVNLDHTGRALGFTGNAMVDYGFLPGLLNGETQQLLLYQSLLVGDLEMNRGGALRFAVGDTFSWNADPGAASLGIIFNRLKNQLRVGGGVKPGGGALDFKLGYSFDFVKYLDVQQSGGAIAAGDLDNMLHTLTFRSDYRFLPRTGFFVLASGGWSSYPLARADGTVNPQAFPLTAAIGLQGQLRAKLAGLLSVGYANPFIVDANGDIVTGDLVGVIGQAEIQWTPSPVTRVGGGLQRSFAPVPLYQFIGTNRVYGTANQLLGRLSLTLSAGYSLLEFGQEVQPLSTQPVGRIDGHLDAAAALTYSVTDWLSLGITDKLEWRATNADELAPAAKNYGFIRNQTFLLASFAY